MISIIILAAGKSSRFGENKLLYRIGQRSVIERVVENALESKAEDILLVVGYEAERIKERLNGAGCRFVYNRVFEEGQSSSIKTGIVSLAKDVDAAMILPGDTALITSKAIDMVIDEYLRTKVPIVVAAYRGKLGHPILFERSMFSEILSINEETRGLRAIVGKYRKQIREVDVGSPEVIFDLDTKEDIKRLSAFPET